MILKVTDNQYGRLF